MATDPIADALASAHKALDHANSVSVPKMSVPAAPAPSQAPAKSTPLPPSIGQELKAKSSMVDKAKSALPKMHDGGPVHADGDYNLRAGEHVLTAPQAKMVRKHALMSVGMANLAKPTDRIGQLSTDKEPEAKTKKPAAKKSTSGITVRPEKSTKKAPTISGKKK